ncbi:MAG: hypothetical protein H7Y43_08940 [Akkermansiaceae bacterium]|nr:hypothetical protein [Verrucomicrobiales bacterium]
MKTRFIPILAAIALVTGCAHQPRGSAADTDQNVLTGGPVKGTTLENMPLAVMGALRKKLPHAEIADIDLTTRDGKEIFEISFVDAGKNSEIYIGTDGQVLTKAKVSP